MLKILRKREQLLSEGKKVAFYFMGQPLGDEKLNNAKSHYSDELTATVSPSSSTAPVFFPEKQYS